MWMDVPWYLFFLFNRSKIMIYVRTLLFECIMKKLIWNKKSYSQREKERKKQRKKKERKNGRRKKETKKEHIDQWLIALHRMKTMLFHL